MFVGGFFLFLFYSVVSVLFLIVLWINVCLLKCFFLIGIYKLFCWMVFVLIEIFLIIVVLFLLWNIFFGIIVVNCVSVCLIIFGLFFLI